MLDWAQRASMPVHVLLTKADKLNYGAAKTALLGVRNKLPRTAAATSIQLFSALNNDGLDALQQQLNIWLEPEQVDSQPA
jgi:GTP-binding protein